MRPRGLRWVSERRTPDKVYITRVFNYGTWEEWHEMKGRFSPRQIEAALKHPLPGQWTKRAKHLAEVLYSVKIPESALISYDA